MSNALVGPRFGTFTRCVIVTNCELRPLPRALTLPPSLSPATGALLLPYFMVGTGESLKGLAPDAPICGYSWTAIAGLVLVVPIQATTMRLLSYLSAPSCAPTARPLPAPLTVSTTIPSMPPTSPRSSGRHHHDHHGGCRALHQRGRRTVWIGRNGRPATRHHFLPSLWWAHDDCLRVPRTGVPTAPPRATFVLQRLDEGE